MDNNDEYGEENPLKKILNKFANKVQKKTAKNSEEVFGNRRCSYIKNDLYNFTIVSLVG
tara:strand:- start:928 stop:1104 length:177 start_codon:yes stop_codon:yes gene_type:complete